MTLLEKQKEFPLLQIKFFSTLHYKGYQWTVADVYRSPECAALYATKGLGIKDSLHCLKLAMDLNFYKGTDWLVDISDYREAGLLWESYTNPDISCFWGGLFEKPSNRDIFHFSLGHNGIK